MAASAWTRRRWLRAATLAAAGTFAHGFSGPARGRSLKNGIDPLTLYGGPATPSLPLIRMAEAGLLQPEVRTARFRMFRGVDEVRAGLVGNGWLVSMVPTNMAAILYNKGMPVRYLAVLTWGLLYFTSTQPGLARADQLRGSRIVLSGKNDVYDCLLRHLLQRSGLVPGRDVTLQYTGAPLEAVQWLRAGKADHALLAEPQCSAALAQRDAPHLHRGLSLGDLRRAVEGDDRIPMAGLMVHRHISESRPDIVDALHRALPRAADWTLAHPDEAARTAVPYFSMPAPVIAAAVPRSRLTAAVAKTQQTVLDEYFGTLLRSDPALIGGKIPDAGFYL